MRTVALLNGGGGRLSRGEAGPLEVAAALRAAGLPAEVREVSGPGLAAAARQAVEAGAELVIAGGGDGTVGAVAGALAGCEVALGVLPLGTFNHFGRDLGMPSDLASAARALAAATPRALDLAEVNGHRFVNNSSLGFYSEVVSSRVEPRIRTRLRKVAASLAAAIRLLGHYRLSRITLTVDGERVTRVSPFVFVSNNAAELQLFRLGRRERLDGGQLFVCVHRGSGHLSVLRTLLLGLWRDVRASGRFEEWLTQELEIELRHRRAVPVFLDGEVLRLQPPLRYRILPGRLLVAVPPPEAPRELSGAASPGPADCRPAAAPTAAHRAARRSRAARAAG